jgi:hypothetical protein
MITIMIMNIPLNVFSVLFMSVQYASAGLNVYSVLQVHGL